MRSFVLIGIFMTVVASALAVASALHVSYASQSIASSVDFLEREYIDRSRLKPEQLKILERTVRSAKGEEAYLTNLHRSLLDISIAGFGGLAVLSGMLTFIAFRSQKRSRENG